MACPNCPNRAPGPATSLEAESAPGSSPCSGARGSGRAAAPRDPARADASWDQFGVLNLLLLLESV